VSDAAQIEASLLALAETGVELRHGLYRRFFAAFPERESVFLSTEATSVRMTDETLQIMYGLAAGEGWAEMLVAELIGTHRMYGTLPLAEYDAFIDLTVEELARALGPQWTADMAAAWGRQAVRFKELVASATADWDRLLPHSASA
jgi:hemoglobin-like flavoprotein